MNEVITSDVQALVVESDQVGEVRSGGEVRSEGVELLLWRTL